MVACSSISIYATDTAEEDTTATTPTVTSEATTTDSTVVEATTTTVTAEATTQTVKRTTYSKYRRGLAAYIRSVNSNIGTDKSLSLAGSFIKYANRRNLDPKVLMAIAENESHFYTGACNPAGYYGMMQCSAALANHYGYKSTSLYKGYVAIDVASRYLKAMKNQFGTYTKAISAYAYGSGTVSTGNYSTALANKLMNTRSSIQRYLERHNYV